MMWKNYMKEAKHGNWLNGFSQTHLIGKNNISVISPPVLQINQWAWTGKQGAFVMHIYRFYIPINEKV